ncbi:MAG TPA: Hpt domain-containing protein [Rhodanobacteraceae bacterium]
MRLEDDIDFTTLNWVKPELDVALTRARQALEAYVETPDNAGPMHACAAELHQVQGTLRMVELYGAAMVVQEMEHLATAVLDAKVVKREAAYDALMRGLVQMPDYLERLQGGYRDIPIVLLPLLNDLRTCRGAQALHESELFRPNLELPLPALAPGAARPTDEGEWRREVSALRLRFQQALLAWFRGGVNGGTLASMRDTLDLLMAQCHTLAGRRLWWITAGVLDGLGQGSLGDHGDEIKQLIGRVDRCMRALLEHGEGTLAEGEAIELEHKLLYYAARAQAGSARLQEVRDTYRLDQLLPDALDVEHARSAMAGHNRELLDTVAQAIKNDLLSVKDALDLFLHKSGNEDPGQLAEQCEVLDRVGDTLGMLGLNVPRRVVGEQRGIINDLASREQPVDEDVLLDVAGALLYVEASLDDHIERLGVHGEEPEDEHALPRSEARQVMAALMREAVGNIGKVKDMLVAFVESTWDHAHVGGAPALLEEVCGALRMVDAKRPVELVQGISRFVHNELIVDACIPSAEQTEKLADALASIEYYLEAVSEHRGGLDHILDVAEQSLADLGYWPVPPARDAWRDDESTASKSESQTVSPATTHLDLSESVSVMPGKDVSDAMVAVGHEELGTGEDLADLRLTETEATAPPAGDDSEWEEYEEEIEEQVPVPDVMAANAGFHDTGDELDPEIRDVFLEEVAEEIDAIHAQLGKWRAQPEDLDRLVPIRRAFHTLKGSGRLVGAQVLGEFSWKIENMLNRVLDGTIEPHPGVQALTVRAADALPGLLTALKGEGAPDQPLVAISEIADRLAAGDGAASMDNTPPPPMQTVKRVVKRRRLRALAPPLQEPPSATLARLSADADMELEPTSVSAVTMDTGDSLNVPVLPPMDPVLTDILRSEVGQHIRTIRASLDAAGSGDVATDEPLLRAVHTLHGAIAMVDVPMLSGLLSPLESWLKRLRALDRPVRAEHADALAQSASVVEQVAAQFGIAEPALPDVSALTRRVERLRDDLPEPQIAYAWYAGTDLPAGSKATEPTLGLTEIEPEAASGIESGTVDSEDDVEGFAVDDLAIGDEPVSAADAEPVVGTGDSQESSDWLGFEATAEPNHGEPAETATAIEPPEDPLEQEAPTSTGTVEVSRSQSSVTESEITEEHEAATAPVTDQTSVSAGQDADEASVLQFHAEKPSTAAPTRSVLGPLPPHFHFPVDPQPAGELSLPDVDSELLDIFVEEANDILDHVDGAMADLREQPQSHDTMIGLQRDLHTLKGGARMATLASIGDLAHAMESLLEALSAERFALNAGMAEALERGFDCLHELVQRVARRMALARPDATIAYFEELVREPQAALEPTPKPEVVEPVAKAEATVAPETQVHAPAHQDRPGLLPEQEPLTRTAQEMIRVRADLVDSLVNYAGEVSIYRARLEQQVSGFRFNLVEFEQTVARLRDQLRKLEIETEAQIIARYQREHQNEGSFDPLELDRFSQLQQYSRALAESVSDLVSLQTMLDDNARQSETLLLQQSRVSSELQEGLMRTRMVPFDSVVPTLRRIVRQAGQETGKRAQLQVTGAHGEMDRNLLERMKAPFEHMLRNALAHGIESPEQRRRSGKPEEGTVAIDVSRDATEVVIRVSDDGAGMDRDAIRAKAIDRGLLRADVQLSDSDLFGFVLESGFSTADEVTQLAGRGVGMDVVANEIKQMGGTLSITSEHGHGTTFILRLPFTLAVTQAVLVKVGESTFAIPMTSVQGVARIKPGEDNRQQVEVGGSFEYAGEEYTIHDLAGLLDVPAGHPDADAQQPLLLARSGDLRAAVRIDAVVGSREIVVKPVGPQISSVPGIFGATIMGDGSVLLILDLAPLVRHDLARSEPTDEAESGMAESMSEAPQALPVHDGRATVMVVDDSITMRKVTSRILERHDYEVMTAKDGMDAVEKLQDRVPDLMLLDIEMPRMDGYELATHMKNDARLKRVPIIMITSRTGEKHRQRAVDIGVDRYVGKPYQEAELVTHIEQLLGAEHG